MAAESERPPYLNGSSGRSQAAKDVEAVSDPASRSTSDGDVTELPPPAAVKSQSLSMSQVPKLSPCLHAASATASTPNSAVSSRDVSPIRVSSRINHSPSTSRGPSQSRKSSQDQSSPTRTPASGQTSDQTTPSPTPTAQFAPAHLSKPPTFSPLPITETPANVPGPEKSNMPSWPGNRRCEQESSPMPNTSHKRSSLSSSEEQNVKVERSAPRTAARGVSGQGSSLETVEELASNPSTPSSDAAAKPATPEESRLHKIDEDPTPRASKQNVESGSDSGGNRSSEPKNERRPSATTRPNTIMPKRSSTSLSTGARGKPADGSVRNMIVETETVSSVPQVSLGVGSGERGNASRADQGTLRMKPSTETIRPRKEKKKIRRPNAVATAHGSSKADIFEAKVASAVDEADVSDSDETFVYESNPPDPYPPRQSRYHSRTPSATSMASQVDQLAGRGRGGMRDGAQSVTGKRSMKFTNSTFNSNLDGEAGEPDGNRIPSRVDGTGTLTPRHHHIGRHGRNGVHPSLFDSDSPFPQAQSQLKSPRHFIGSGYRHSRHANTRSSPNYKTINGSKKAGDVYTYDFDAEGADDERTPLVGTPRGTRSRHGRRPNSASLRQMEYMAQRQRSFLSRYGSCVIITLLLLIMAGGAISFIVAATKPLVDVQVVAIQNVLASEQEIMLDLNVEAVNPNLFPVTIDQTDVNIFAKSRYVGTDKFWRDHGSGQELDRFPRTEHRRRRWQLSQMVRCLGKVDCIVEAMSGGSPSEHVRGGVDIGTDPVSGDPEGDPQTMLLGRVFHFDSPLSFEASPWNHLAAGSKGQIRLARPGNRTEEGGTERWERVLQHPFELIVRGVVKYQLPLSSRFHSASVSSSVKVIPDDGDDDGDDDSDDFPPSNDTARISVAARRAPRLHLPVASDARQSGVIKRQFTA